jgi:molecular chaperone HtpG
MTPHPSERTPFKAEIQQVLDILIHSLYSEREIFLRELVSNASDALNRFKLEALTDQNVLQPGAELAIWIEADPETRTLTIRDSGVGMTREEMVQYLGTIAHSGAKSFIEALQEAERADAAKDVIGQFGVGFYSVFMVADKVTVTSRSFRPEAEAALWSSEGQGSFEVGPAQRAERGTVVEITLKEDAQEFAEPYRLRQIIKTHSDFVTFPIYLKEKDGEAREAWTQVNQRTALWREAPRDVKEEQYQAFYSQLTFDFQAPLRTIHFSADVPIQFHALLYVPSRRDYKLIRDEYGLKLYARKVLIRETFKELLPPYLRFIEGVVDSEDLPLNVSREAVQASPVLRKIKAALVGRLAGEFKRMAEDKETFRGFYKEFGQYLKEGVATDAESAGRFVDLLRFPSSLTEEDDWVSLEGYLSRMKPDQKEIYYLLGDDYGVVSKSAHLEVFKRNNLEVLYLTEPMDAFMLMGLSRYGDKPLKDIGDAELELPEQDEPEKTEEAPSDEAFGQLLAKVKETLGNRVEDVRESRVLTDSAARLVNPAGGAASSVQRVQRLMGKDAGVPKKILELNRRSDLIENLAARLESDPDDALLSVLIEQLYENELLMEGLHPNPAEMIPRIQRLMAEATKKGRER